MITFSGVDPARSTATHCIQGEFDRAVRDAYRDMVRAIDRTMWDVPPEPVRPMSATALETQVRWMHPPGRLVVLDGGGDTSPPVGFSAVVVDGGR